MQELIDWKLLLLKVLRCFSEQEGTWYEGRWKAYGISAEERDAIERAYALMEGTVEGTQECQQSAS